jgi:hypothetical protein
MEYISELVRACGFDLQVHLVPLDDHGWSMVERNRELTPVQRLHNMVQAANFVHAGREAMKSRSRV